QPGSGSAQQALGSAQPAAADQNTGTSAGLKKPQAATSHSTGAVGSAGSPGDDQASSPGVGHNNASDARTSAATGAGNRNKNGTSPGGTNSGGIPGDHNAASGGHYNPTAARFSGLSGQDDRRDAAATTGHGNDGPDRASNIPGNGQNNLRDPSTGEAQLTWTEPGYSPLKAQRVHIGTGVLLDIPVKANSAVSTRAGDGASQKPAPVTKARQRNKGNHSFYAGVFVAPDLSTVKFQSIKGMGITTGILFGYTINDRWAIETGAYLDIKKYYTDGEYFNKKKIPALWNVDIKTVDGSCNMIEIPLNARYNLGTSEKRKWFVTGGLTSYLMYQETYAYQLASAGYSWPKSATYHNPSQSWFSQIGLSMGYEQKIGKIGNLRLEPYLRIPLAGIGTGSLPITSAGLNIGLTHKFR
ncbi:MAG TPA: outer membrane beta-barrel protein, partial [Puia sp.]|nr:outer membrane beta-barrel protein [Puia sp.]